MNCLQQLGSCADAGGYLSRPLKFSELESFWGYTRSFLSVTSEIKKFERHCHVSPLPIILLNFQMACFQGSFHKNTMLQTKNSPRVSLAVAESNVVCVLSHGREQWGLSCFSSITLEKLMSTDISRKTGFFCLKEEYSHTLYSTFLWALWRFCVHALWSSESFDPPLSQ